MLTRSGEIQNLRQEVVSLQRQLRLSRAINLVSETRIINMDREQRNMVSINSVGPIINELNTTKRELAHTKRQLVLTSGYNRLTRFSVTSLERRLQSSKNQNVLLRRSLRLAKKDLRKWKQQAESHVIGRMVTDIMHTQDVRKITKTLRELMALTQEVISEAESVKTDADAAWDHVTAQAEDILEQARLALN